MLIKKLTKGQLLTGLNTLVLSDFNQSMKLKINRNLTEMIIYSGVTILSDRVHNGVAPRT